MEPEGYLRSPVVAEYLSDAALWVPELWSARLPCCQCNEIPHMAMFQPPPAALLQIHAVSYRQSRTPLPPQFSPNRRKKERARKRRKTLHTGHTPHPGPDSFILSNAEARVVLFHLHLVLLVSSRQARLCGGGEGAETCFSRRGSGGSYLHPLKFRLASFFLRHALAWVACGQR